MYNNNNNNNTGEKYRYNQQPPGYYSAPGPRQTGGPPPPLGQLPQQQRQPPPSSSSSSFTTYSAPPSTYSQPYQVPVPGRYQQGGISKSGSPAPPPPSIISSNYRSIDGNKSHEQTPVAMSYEQAIAQQQSIYDYSAPASSNGGISVGGNPSPAASSEKDQQDTNNLTVKRKGGGQKWQDSSLLEWDPTHFRLFVGNLGGDMNDEVLFKAFSKYKSIKKAKVIQDKRTLKTKGYGFVSFSDSNDYFKAFKEMNGKYVGTHPVLLRKAITDVRPTVNKRGNKRTSKLKGPSNSTR